MSTEITQKNPCGRTWRQRLRSWFWGTRVGVALHALMGRPTAYKLTIEGRLILGNNSLVSTCIIRPLADHPALTADLYRTKISNG